VNQNGEILRRWTERIGASFARGFYLIRSHAKLGRHTATVEGELAPHLLLACMAVLCASATISEAQSDQSLPAPRVLVESLRVTDSLSREAAIQLRASLAARVKPTVLQVVSTAVFDRTQQARLGGIGRPWDWTSVREFARQVAAEYIVDITAVRDSTMFQVAALVVHPARSGEPIPVPIFARRSLNDAVAKLADHLAAKSWPPDR